MHSYGKVVEDFSRVFTMEITAGDDFSEFCENHLSFVKETDRVSSKRHIQNSKHSEVVTQYQITLLY